MRPLLPIPFAVALLLGGGACERNDKQAEEEVWSEDTVSTDTVSTDAGTTPSPVSILVYFARGEKIGVATRLIPATKAVASAAIRELLSGPTPEETRYGLGSTIPTGTDLRGLTVHGGTATVDLSDEYDSGGGVLSMTMRLAQVVYTLTQFPTVERVLFRIEGVPVTTLGGEGILIGTPQTRGDYEQVTPAILLEAPGPGDSVTSPLRIRGTANTFEAAFMVRIVSADDSVLVEAPMMATSGSGTRGTFNAEIPIPAAASGAGLLVVFEYSAKDGSPIHVVEIPLTFETAASREAE